MAMTEPKNNIIYILTQKIPVGKLSYVMDVATEFVGMCLPTVSHIWGFIGGQRVLH